MGNFFLTFGLFRDDGIGRYWSGFFCSSLQGCCTLLPPSSGTGKEGPHPSMLGGDPSILGKIVTAIADTAVAGCAVSSSGPPHVKAKTDKTNNAKAVASYVLSSEKGAMITLWIPLGVVRLRLPTEEVRSRNDLQRLPPVSFQNVDSRSFAGGSGQQVGFKHWESRQIPHMIDGMAPSQVSDFDEVALQPSNWCEFRRQPQRRGVVAGILTLGTMVMEKIVH